MSQFAPPEAVAMLLMETRQRPLHIAVLQLFKPPEGARPEFARELFEAMLDQREVAL
jgi:diacylglycerol O-acyltransferase